MKRLININQGGWPGSMMKLAILRSDKIIPTISGKASEFGLEPLPFTESEITFKNNARKSAKTRKDMNDVITYPYLKIAAPTTQRELAVTKKIKAEMT